MSGYVVLRGKNSNAVYATTQPLMLNWDSFMELLAEYDNPEDAQTCAKAIAALECAEYRSTL